MVLWRNSFTGKFQRKTFLDRVGVNGYRRDSRRFFPKSCVESINVYGGVVVVVISQWIRVDSGVERIKIKKGLPWIRNV